ncbi:uncharacterized transporter slc-17.2-like [Ylistrum balloti]|uniref:uncharacterized transporter slc-17.2-like n=1 Tax=Ylistrum balloti TaxID=509963 RepID=UPI002905DF8D|nr:uncharacterized transporter slc-17.2-like [Ylistrum balloti]
MVPDADNIPLINDDSREHKVTLKERLTSCRWHVGYVTCLTLACTMLLRINMSMVVVCMNPPNMTSLVVVNGTNYTVVDDYMKYYVEWDSTMEGLLISGNYIGQMITALVLGTMSGRYSSKYIIASMISVMAVSSVLTPAFVFVSDYIVLVLRIIVGMATSGLEPCATQLLSNWAPLNERAQMMVLVETARSLGGMMNYILAGLLCSIPLFGGWPFIFFVFSGLNLLVLILWACLVYDAPSIHPRISTTEKNYIHLHKASVAQNKTLHIPWLQVISSKAVWGCVLGFLTYGFLFISLAICLPLYFEQVLELDSTLNGFASALPFLGRIVGAIIFGYIADWIFCKQWLSITNLRKVFQVTGLIGSAPFLIWITYLGKDDAILAVVLMVVYWFILTAMNSGFRVNFADIAPRYAGLLNGICMCLNGFISIFVPIIVTAITPNGTKEEWRAVFYGCVGVSVVGAVVFVVLASGEEQEWAKDQTSDSNLAITDAGNKSIDFNPSTTTDESAPLTFNRLKENTDGKYLTRYTRDGQVFVQQLELLDDIWSLVAGN